MSDQVPSDSLLYRLRQRVEIARAVESNVSLHPDQVLTLVECAEALKRFAEMDRPGCDLGELACSRGIASDMTVLVSRDFRLAAEALAKLEAL